MNACDLDDAEAAAARMLFRSWGIVAVRTQASSNCEGLCWLGLGLLRPLDDDRLHLHGKTASITVQRNAEWYNDYAQLDSY